MAACGVCSGKSYVIDRRGSLSVARVCDCSQPCKRCGGVGHTYAVQQAEFSAKVGKREYEVVVPCTCRLLQRRVELFNGVDLPGVYNKASFDGFSTASPNPNVGPALEKAKQTALQFAATYNKGQPSRGFVLSGPVGTGKTHLLAAVLSHLALEMGVRGKYVEISLLYSTIRRGFQEGKSGGEIIQPLSEIDVLAIDELGKGRGSQFEQETLDELIARRYNAGRTTLFATNYSLDAERKSTRPASGGYRNAAEEAKNAAKDSELLRERVGERIYSRLCEMCEFVELPAQTPDHRRFIADRARGRLGA